MAIKMKKFCTCPKSNLKIWFRVASPNCFRYLPSRLRRNGTRKFFVLSEKSPLMENVGDNLSSYSIYRLDTKKRIELWYTLTVNELQFVIRYTLHFCLKYNHFWWRVFQFQFRQLLCHRFTKRHYKKNIDILFVTGSDFWFRMNSRNSW